jgi:hypothetical protein
MPTWKQISRHRHSAKVDVSLPLFASDAFYTPFWRQQGG